MYVTVVEHVQGTCYDGKRILLVFDGFLRLKQSNSFWRAVRGCFDICQSRHASILFMTFNSLTFNLFSFGVSLCIQSLKNGASSGATLCGLSSLRRPISTIGTSQSWRCGNFNISVNTGSSRGRQASLDQTRMSYFKRGA